MSTGEYLCPQVIRWGYPCYYCHQPTTTTTTTNNTTTTSWGSISYWCPHCNFKWWGYTHCPHCNPTPDSAPESAEGEDMSLIDERQLEVLDDFRRARDAAKRHAQTKVDKATMMKIQAEALIAESRELVSEINEETPYPNETGADIGPIPGAGGAQR